MASLRTWTEMFALLFFAIMTLSPIPETTGVSYPLQRQGLLPAGKKVGGSLSASIKPKPKKKKSVGAPASPASPAKSTIGKKPTQNRLADEFPMYKAELVGNQIFSKPSPLRNQKDEEKIKPYYDCPLFNNENNVDGNAIIKPDPYDCGCCYYCNWGIHYVQCCSWPLLWNDKVKSCDWYWKVTCLTYDGWDTKK